jgi:hypothetical protein
VSVLNKLIFNILPFIFPVASILIFLIDIGRYTAYIGISILILGFIYTLYDIMIQKKAIVASTINIFLIPIICLVGVIFFFLMIKSGV